MLKTERNNKIVEELNSGYQIFSILSRICESIERTPTLVKGVKAEYKALSPAMVLSFNSPQIPFSKIQKYNSR
jgi:hypothetical protein